MSAEVADLLDRAADRIEQVGWWSRSHSAAGLAAVCAANAIFLESEDDEPVFKAAWRAYATAAGIDVERAPVSIWQWNDAPERTKDEVLDVMRRAAALEREPAFA